MSKQAARLVLPDTPQTQLKLLYSRREAASALSMGVRNLDKLIASGTLKVRRIGGRVLVHIDTLKVFAQRDHPLSS